MERFFCYLLIAKKDRTMFESTKRKTVFLFKYKYSSTKNRLNMNYIRMSKSF